MERRIAKAELAKRLTYRRRVRLSEVDREIVRAVIREVEKIEKYHATP